jgi:putative sterol carrier protein
VAVKFLSEEWANSITEALNSSDEFKSASSGQQANLQQVVTDVPDGGEVKYYFKVGDGSAEVSLGELADAEATLTQSYEVAAALSKGELNGQQAFMQGKLKIAGNMMKLMQLQGVFNALPNAVSGVDVEY